MRWKVCFGAYPTALILLVWLAGPGSAWAYTIVLKDGSRIVATEKYQVQGDRAMISLPNGTQTFIPFAEIDVPLTARFNEQNLGTAVVVEDGKSRPLLINEPDARIRERTLEDLVRDNEQTASSSTEDTSQRTVRTTPAGYVDLSSVERAPFAPAAAAQELSLILHGSGLNDFRLNQGTAANRILVELTTNSESQVFASLTSLAEAVIRLRQRHAGVEALEVLMVSESSSRAGQFVLSAENAPLLANGIMAPGDFFLEYVQF